MVLVQIMSKVRFGQAFLAQATVLSYTEVGLDSLRRKPETNHVAHNMYGTRAHRERASEMILTAPHLIRALRWIPPGVTILGGSCTFLNLWTAIRALTFPLPGWFYARLEEMLYGNYQAMVGFWYETWSGVEVRNSHMKLLKGYYLLRCNH